MLPNVPCLLFALPVTGCPLAQIDSANKIGHCDSVWLPNGGGYSRGHRDREQCNVGLCVVSSWVVVQLGFAPALRAERLRERAVVS